MTTILFCTIMPRTQYKDYSLQSRLHFRIHAAQAQAREAREAREAEAPGLQLGKKPQGTGSWGWVVKRCNVHCFSYWHDELGCKEFRCALWK